MIAIESFEQHRPLLFSIAYRMLGSVMDAEDAVQETYLRWQGAEREQIARPKAFLTTVLTRLCIDQLRSARVQREEYVGPWLPEPLITEGNDDPAERATQDESLSMAFLVLLESLTPVERAVFLMHEVFGYEYDEIAGIVGKSAANCRQIGHRAREYVRARRPRFSTSQQEHERLMGQFVQACLAGDMQGLMGLLADDVTLWADGGGKVHAALKPIHSADHVARFFLGILRKVPFEVTARPVTANGGPALLITLEGTRYNVLSFDIVDGRIQALRYVANPEKLRHLRTPNGRPHG
jgi:RNA polymerase sigma-70 factor (ECF subfamily)